MNRMIVIGWLGNKTVYVNVPKEEAVRRFTISEDYIPPDDMIDEYEFADEFGAYDVWGDKPGVTPRRASVLSANEHN